MNGGGRRTQKLFEVDKTGMRPVEWEDLRAMSLPGLPDRVGYAPKNLNMKTVQQEKVIEHLKDVEQEKEQLEKKYDELRLKHSELEQREKDLKMKMALDGYEQLCYNIGTEGRSSVRQLLVNLCQAEFERNFEVPLMLNARSKKIAQGDKEVKNELESLFEKEFHFAQTRAKGNIWMIGELYNYGILSDNMIQYFISRLLDEHSKESWPWLVELIVTVHSSLSSNKVDMDKYFRRIKEILKSKTYLSNISESSLQQIILEWEMRADPEKISTLVKELVPESEPVACKPTIYTVQSYEKSNNTDHKPFKDFDKPTRGKSRGRYRGERAFGNGAYVQNRPPVYSAHAPMPLMPTMDGYSDWYEQNVCSTYGMPRNRPFYDSYGQPAARQGRNGDMRGEQKMKRKPRQQQQTQTQSTVKKELLDGEMKIGFRKPAERKSEAVQQEPSTSGASETPAASQVSPKEEQVVPATPQIKLLSALLPDVEIQTEEITATEPASVAQQSQTTITTAPISKVVVPKPKEQTEISSHSDDDDSDVLIETVTEEEIKLMDGVLCSVKQISVLAASPSEPQQKDEESTNSGKALKPELGNLPPDEAKVVCSSEDSEYSSPLHSPVPFETKEKSNEIWTRLSLLPQPKVETSSGEGEKTED